MASDADLHIKNSDRVSTRSKGGGGPTAGTGPDQPGLFVDVQQG